MVATTAKCTAEREGHGRANNPSSYNVIIGVGLSAQMVDDLSEAADATGIDERHQISG